MCSETIRYARPAYERIPDRILIEVFFVSNPQSPFAGLSVPTLRAPPISLPGHEIVTNRTGFFRFWGQKPEITGPVGHKFVSGHSPDTLLGGALSVGFACPLRAVAGRTMRAFHRPIFPSGKVGQHKTGPK